jgi:hypothetical protein
MDENIQTSSVREHIIDPTVKNKCGDNIPRHETRKSKERNKRKREREKKSHINQNILENLISQTSAITGTKRTNLIFQRKLKKMCNRPFNGYYMFTPIIVYGDPLIDHLHI